MWRVGDAGGDRTSRRSADSRLRLIRVGVLVLYILLMSHAVRGADGSVHCSSWFFEDTHQRSCFPSTFGDRAAICCPSEMHQSTTV